METAREFQKKTSASLTTLKPLTVWIIANCGTIFKEIGIPDHPTCLLRNLYRVQTTNRTGHGKTDWFKIGKRVWQVCILAPCLFYFYAEYIMQNAWLDLSQGGIKSAGRNINILTYTDDSTLMAESERN